MKTTILIHDEITQLILHAESDHERDVLATLAKLPNTHRDKFYMNRGGWVTQDGIDHYGLASYASSEYRDREKDLVITLPRNVAAPEFKEQTS